MASLIERTRVIADAIRFAYEKQSSDTPDIKSARNQVHDTLVGKSVTLAAELKQIDNIPENIRQNAVIRLLEKLNTEDFAVSVQSIINPDKVIARNNANEHQRQDLAQLLKNANDDLNQSSIDNNHFTKLSETSPALSHALQNGHSVSTLIKLVKAGYYDSEAVNYYQPPERDLMGAATKQSINAVETRAGRLSSQVEIKDWADRQEQISQDKLSTHAAFERKESYAIKAELDRAGIIPHGIDRSTAATESLHGHRTEWQQITESVRAKHDVDHQPHESDHRNTLPDTDGLINHYDSPEM